ncbi:MAG: hypothetical protein V4704_10670 [Pseudomonadota bacterium]
MKIRIPLACVLALALSACGGGTKLVRKPMPVPVDLPPIAVAHDAQLAAELRFVIVRNGPAAWAKNADWDEYLLAVGNVGTVPLRIDSVTVTDSRGNVNGTHSDRAELVAASKQATRRYRDAGLKVEAGRGGAGLAVAGVGAGVLAYGAATAAATSAALGAGGAAGGGAAAAAGGLVLAAPVLLGVGIMRMVNNGKVDNRIEDRATHLPLTIAPGAEAALDLFYPLSPSPLVVVVHYHDGQAAHRLELDVSKRLTGLHLRPAAAR